MTGPEAASPPLPPTRPDDAAEDEILAYDEEREVALEVFAEAAAGLPD